MRLRALAFFLGASLCAAQGAHAQPAAVTSNDAAARAATNAALPLVLSLGSSKLAPEAIRSAIELELRRPITLSKSETQSGASLSVAVHANNTATVSFREPTGLTRSRSISLPQAPARAPEVIALLAGNLSRDEAAELLASLAAKRAAETAPSPVAEAAPPAAADRSASTPAATSPNSSASTPAQATPSKVPPPKEVAKGAAAPSAKPTKIAPLLRAPYPLFDLTAAHPVGVLPHSERYVVNGELGLAYSRVGAIEGAGIDLMVLRTDHDVRGTSFASFYNETGGHTYGATASGLIARSADVTGATFAGVAGFHRDVVGCSVGGLADFGRDVQGCTLGGIFSDARDFSGLQLAGLVNRARNLDGVQFVGATNIAERIRGLQIGVVNVADDVEGVQFGVVNVARHVKGAAIGLVSVAGNGRVQPVLWASTFMPLNAAMKFQLGLLYTQFGGGISPGNDTWSYELGGGMHIPLGPLFLEPGASYSEQHATNHSFASGHIEHVHYRLAAGLDFRAISPFIGVAYMQRFAHDLAGVDSDAGRFEGFTGIAFF